MVNAAQAAATAAATNVAMPNTFKLSAFPETRE
jgi:hypothetical protein